MEFENTFEVKAPIAEVYETLMDLERVVVCMPGAKLQTPTERGGYGIGVTVKLGPMTVTYGGELHVLERDAETHAAKMRISAREVRGQGAATAELDMNLCEEADITHATVNAKVNLTGRVASMGHGIIEDVSAALVEQFAENLAAMLEGAEPLASGRAGAYDERPHPEVSSGKDATAGVSSARHPSIGKEAPTSELRILSLVLSRLNDRLRDPRVVAFALAGTTACGYWLGARARG